MSPTVKEVRQQLRKTGIAVFAATAVDDDDYLFLQVTKAELEWQLRPWDEDHVLTRVLFRDDGDIVIGR